MLSNALTLNWAYGFNKNKINGTCSLCVNERNALFLISSHSAVIYDFEHRTQTILQGHCNVISCCAVDKNKRWIVTADIGIDPIMVIWDAVSYVPLKTFSLDEGIESIDISDDAMYIATLSHPNLEFSSIQNISIWAWTTEGNEAILRSQIASDDYQKSIKFDKVNATQVVTTGCKSVLFWNWDNFTLTSYSGKVSKSDLGSFNGDFVSTIYLPNTENALTATTEGYVIVWESNSEERTNDNTTKRDHNNATKDATKVLKLVDGGINILETTVNNYLVIACEDGAVRFYDYFLRLEAWFEDLNAGPITSVSFSVQNCPYPYGEAGAPGLKFWVPDFIVGTSDGFVVGIESSVFDEVRKQDRRGTLLMQGMSDEVIALACHPTESLIAIACSNGVLQVWNYEMKLLMILREFNNSTRFDDKKLTQTKPRSILRPKCMSFDSSGKILALGFTSGLIKLLHTNNLEDLHQFSPSSEPIISLKFSPSGLYIAAYDSNRHVILFKREEVVRASSNTMGPSSRSPSRGTSVPHSEISFSYIGRARAHTAPVTGITFGFKDGIESLISISEDQYCVEYDLTFSSVSAGVLCVKSISTTGSTSCSQRIEVIAKPTAIMWHPKLKGDMEDRFVTANDLFKFKEYNADSKQCRKTSLAPRFGTAPTSLLAIPGNNTAEFSTRYLAFSTSYRVIGLISFPLTGDPSKMMGIVAHPGEVTAIDISCDGNYIFSAGGSDLSVNMWKIELENVNELHDTSSSEQHSNSLLKEENTNTTSSLASMKSYFSLLEGGEGGELHNDIIDYFYYCQLRQLGEDSMETRTLTGTIPLEEIPSLFRAVGYYPSEEEVTDIINEIRYKTFVNTGETQELIGLNEVIKLYINHRPVLPLDKHFINSAFVNIYDSISSSTNGVNQICWDALKDCLMNEGEKISENDLDAYLMALTGKDSESMNKNKSFDARSFAEELLGFEDFSDNM